MHARTATPTATDVLAMSDGAPTPAATAGHLVRRAAGGDVDGFAFQHLRDVEEAHDLAQEIFVKLYRNLARYDSERPFEPWFWKLAANTTINYRRRRIPTPTDQAAEERITAADPGATEHDAALVTALAQLDPAYRLPILLHYY